MVSNGRSGFTSDSQSCSSLVSLLSLLDASWIIVRDKCLKSPPPSNTSLSSGLWTVKVWETLSCVKCGLILFQSRGRQHMCELQNLSGLAIMEKYDRNCSPTTYGGLQLANPNSKAISTIRTIYTQSHKRKDDNLHRST